MAQGHWRRLKPGQVGEGRFGEKTPGRTWVDTKRTPSADKAKEKGKVPAPRMFRQEGDHTLWAVPGGVFVFVVHKSAAKEFASIVEAEGAGWVESKAIRSFMKEKESQGKFGIFRLNEPMLEY